MKILYASCRYDPLDRDAGSGVANTVVDGVSGVVLPKGSPAEAYVDVINRFIDEPERYAHLRKTTRARYEAELNWSSAGERIVAEIQRVLNMKNTVYVNASGEHGNG